MKNLNLHTASTIAGFVTAIAGFVEAGLILADKGSQAKKETKKEKEEKKK